MNYRKGSAKYDFPEDISIQKLLNLNGRELANLIITSPRFKRVIEEHTVLKNRVKACYVYRRFRKNKKKYERIIQQENANRSFILE
mmetsp:Transcript_16974/g.20816  ORF Transcript_16974/g.20816 Transcript_16974/m.20816 type:complete len:86 (-) Transcript_16974:70-327(-)